VKLRLVLWNAEPDQSAERAASGAAGSRTRECCDQWSGCKETDSGD
jgi:hypothetical protein